MRLNYYRFPENIDAHTRWVNGTCRLKAICSLDENTPHPDPSECSFYTEEGCQQCPYYKVIDSEDTVEGCSVSYAKKLLKTFGGYAWTCHIDRDGGCFETTPISIKGNNSEFHYNHHL